MKIKIVCHLCVGADSARTSPTNTLIRGDQNEKAGDNKGGVVTCLLKAKFVS